MANYSAGNVVVVDTSGAIAGPVEIEAVKYIAGSGTPSVSIKQNDSSGNVIYEEDGTADKVEQVCIKVRGNVYVTVGGTGTKLYLYLK